MQNPTHIKSKRGVVCISTNPSMYDTKYLVFFSSSRERKREKLCYVEQCEHASVVVSGGVRGWRGHNRRCRRLALVALGKEAKSVNLPYKIGHTGPSSKPKSNHKNPYHNEGIKNIHCCPTRHEERRFLCCILQ